MRIKFSPQIVFVLVLVGEVCLGQEVVKAKVKLSIDSPELQKEVLPEGQESVVVMDGKHRQNFRIVGAAKLVEPRDGCSTYKYPDQSGSSIYFIEESGTCTLATKIQFAQKANAKAQVFLGVTDSLEKSLQGENSPGVHTPVLMVKRSDGQKVIQMLAQENSEVKLSLNFYQQRHESIELDLWFAPNSPTALNFVKNLAEFPLNLDLNLPSFVFKPHYGIWHCSDCEKNSYSTVKPGCFSGGRYCAFGGTGGEARKSELVLEETLHMICFNKYMKESMRGGVLPSWLVDMNQRFLDGYLAGCQGEDLNSDCVWKYLEREHRFWAEPIEGQGAHDWPETARKQVVQCYKDSFETNGEFLNPMIHDNKLLRVELEDFKKISAYEKFPFLKVNEVNYPGKIDYVDVKEWICEKILGPGQCAYGRFLGPREGSGSYNGMYIIIGLILIQFFGSLCICRRRLKERYENELNLKIDQSLSGFLA